MREQERQKSIGSISFHKIPKEIYRSCDSIYCLRGTCFMTLLEQTNAHCRSRITRYLRHWWNIVCNIVRSIKVMNTQVHKLLFAPVCAQGGLQGGPLGPNHFKYFPIGISVRNLHHICIHLIKSFYKTTINQQKEH